MKSGLGVDYHKSAASGLWDEKMPCRCVLNMQPTSEYLFILIVFKKTNSGNNSVNKFHEKINVLSNNNP